MPSGNVDVPIIEDNFDGTIRVQYNPKEDGVHELILLHDGAPVQGYNSVIFYYACSANRAIITSHHKFQSLRMKIPLTYL